MHLGDFCVYNSINKYILENKLGRLLFFPCKNVIHSHGQSRTQPLFGSSRNLITWEDRVTAQTMTVQETKSQCHVRTNFISILYEFDVKTELSLVNISFLTEEYKIKLDITSLYTFQSIFTLVHSCWFWCQHSPCFLPRWQIIVKYLALLL